MKHVKLFEAFEISNNRNIHGVKDASNCYLTIKGVKYKQWSDCLDCSNKEEANAQLVKDKEEFPEYDFILKNMPKNQFRIYYTEKNK